MADVINRATAELRRSVNTPDYDPGDWVINPDLSAVAGVDPKFWTVDGDSVREMTTAEKDAALLDAEKARRYSEITRRTHELIAQGFSFGGKQFSLSTNARIEVSAIHVVRDDPAVVYPIHWNTLADDDTLPLPDSATVHDFYLTAVGTYRACMDSGTALKDQIRAATTLAEVAAVVDTR